MGREGGAAPGLGRAGAVRGSTAGATPSTFCTPSALPGAGALSCTAGFEEPTQRELGGGGSIGGREEGDPGPLSVCPSVPPSVCAGPPWRRTPTAA